MASERRVDEREIRDLGGEGLFAAAWSVIGLVAIIAAVFARTIDFGFTDDDYILARAWTTSEVTSALRGAFDPSGYLIAYFRPLAAASFALEWHVWGTNRWGYHLVNIALHTAATLAVWLVIHRLRLPAWTAFVGAAYFALVPSNAITVVYVAQRTDAIVATCLCLAVLAILRWLRSGDDRWLLAVGLAYVVALSAKEVAVALVPLAAVVVLFDGANSMPPDSHPTSRVGTHWAREARRWWRAIRLRSSELVLLLVTLSLITVAYLVYRAAVLPSGSLGGRFAETQHPIRALVGGFNSVLKGVPWEVTPLPWPAVVAAFAVGLVLCPCSRHWRIVVFGIGATLSGILPLAFSGGVEPRLLYVAQIGFAVAIAGLAAVYGEAIRAAAGPRRRAVVAITASIAIAVAGTIVVSQFRAQDTFAPGSDRQLEGALRVWTHPAADVVPAENMAVIERQLRDAGLIDAEGQPLD